MLSLDITSCLFWRRIRMVRSWACESSFSSKERLQIDFLYKLPLMTILTVPPDCLLCLKNITLLYKDIFYKTIEAEIYEILRINPRLRFWKGYNLCWKSVNTIQFFYGRCPWSIRVQIHGWRHAKLVFFVLFNMARGFENVCEIQFRIKASEILEKSSTRGNYNRKKNGEKGTKKLLSTLECLNYKKSSQLDSCHRVSSLWDIRRFAKCFRHYSALSKKRRWKTFRTNCIQLR